ncbi:MAG: serine/threonine-protein kinase, partial [Vicinamibacterales bacterium]
MALIPGTRLGVYEVTAQIGEGGMGQVYRGTDTTLGRQVAIKILPEAFAADPERLARFEREAKTLASLNHPNIAAIYAVEKSGGTHALVMELVEGDDLSELIVRRAGPSGPAGLPVDEALPIAKQIAEALEAAHEQGIIHRDLKPANIKVRPDGAVKVLDFGLAKAMDAPNPMSPSVSQAPTITTPAMMTGVGMILGTAAYMSPEQARGKAVDKRADIWAFGAVLFEMLTGQRAFSGEDVADVLSRVLQREPDWSAFPSGLSPTLVVFLKRCLQKDPKQRVGDIRDVRLALEGAFETAAPQTTPSSATRPRARAWLPWGVAAVSMLTAAGIAVVHFRETPPLLQSIRFQV